jgi:hypothetical protein
MDKKWLPLMNKNIKIHTKHGLYWGTFCGVMNGRLYARDVRIGWVSMPDLDQSKISGIVKRDWDLGNVVKLEVMCDENNGKYEEVKINWKEGS